MIIRISKIFSIVFFLLNAALFAQDNKGYRIELKVDNFQGKVCYLGYPYGDKKYG